MLMIPHFVVDDPTVSAAKLNSDLERICDWAKRWLVTINASKTKCMTFSVKRFKPFHPFIVFDNEIIDEITQHTHLGVTLATTSCKIVQTLSNTFSSFQYPPYLECKPFQEPMTRSLQLYCVRVTAFSQTDL